MKTDNRSNYVKINGAWANPSDLRYVGFFKNRQLNALEAENKNQFEARVFWTCKVVVFGAATFWLGALLGILAH